MYYANCRQLSDEISFLVSTSQPPLRWLCLDASAVDNVDYSAAETLRSVHASLKAKGIRLVIAEVMGRRTRTSYHFRELLGEHGFYDHLDDVLNHYRQQFNLPLPPTPSGPTQTGDPK